MTGGRRQKTKKTAGVTVLWVLVGVLAAAGVVLAGLTALPSLSEAPSSEQGDGTSTTFTTSTTTPTPTTMTTTTTSTTASTAGTEAWLDENGLLQYPSTGHYVQKDNYATETIPWNLLLVNDWNGMPTDYEKSVSFVAVGNNQKVDARMQADLKAMLQAGKAYGIGVQSGYRSASHQGTLYWRKVNVQKDKGLQGLAAQEAAGKIVKRPGYSEHNTGLAVDLGGSGNFKLSRDFEKTAAFQWLMEHCGEYGFILRFPEGKESITGVIYEPWHYRYVGKEAATAIMEQGLCLEEYLEQKKK